MAASMQFVGAVRQTIWGWPAVLNLFLGGMGSLFYTGSHIWLDAGSGLQGDPHAGIRLIGPVLTIIGFMAVVTEAGRPSRAVFLLHHLYRSWMSREVLFGAVFIGAAFANALYPTAALKWVAISAAVMMAVCQAMMLYDGMGVTLWYAPIVPLQCLLANVGAAAALLLALISPFDALPLTLIGVLMAVLLLDGWAWYHLMRIRPTAADRAARQPLYRTAHLMLVLGIGHLVPLVLLFVLATVQLARQSQIAAAGPLVILLALFVLAGGIGQKAGVLLGGNSLRPMRRGGNRLRPHGGYAGD